MTGPQTSANPPLERIAVLVSFSGEGGVEKMIVNLVNGFSARGVQVDLLTLRADSAHLQALPESVRVVSLASHHSRLAVPSIARYLRKERPPAMLVAKDRAIRAALSARSLARVETRIIGRIGTTLSAALADQPPLMQWWRRWPLRRAYRSIDAIVAVSQGVAEDVTRTTGLPAERIEVINNPVITPQLATAAALAPTHPWLSEAKANRRYPVLVAAGRLTRQKDFTTLLLAFAELQTQHRARLVIFGEGRERHTLQSLATELGISKQLSLPGFESRLHSHLAQADLFVLSSAWEGSPNVLTEALALGVPAVATDCPSGPREILQNGKFGPLVAVGDASALAQAIADTLATPAKPERLKSAVKDFTLARSCHLYLSTIAGADRL